jgi:translocation and assembly module TamA
MAFRISGTDEVLGSDTGFFQANAAGKIILPLWSTARVLARGEVGWTAEQDFDALPFSVRYFTGGDNTVRGYQYKSLGPKDAEGQVIGGSELVVASIELDQQVFGNWSVAAFVDMGNAFNTFADMSLKTGVGGGVRWYSPLGPIRFDIAVPLANDAPDNFRIHLTIGPDL